MVGNYKVITLCGSTKFKEDFLRIQKELTLKGNIVISVGLFGHAGDDEVWVEGTKEMLDDMHKRKIDMADEIYVINKNCYIGESTKSEIKYAQKTGKLLNSWRNIIMVDKKTWQEFRESGLFWWINMILHTFGWAIVVEIDEETKEITCAYPARVKFRGFDEKNNEDGYIKVSKYLKENSEDLYNESKN